MKPKRSLLSLSLAAVFVGAVGVANGHSTPAPTDAELRAMIGQMVLVGFHGDSEAAAGYQTVSKQAENGEITGVIFLRRNIKNRETVETLTGHLRTSGKIPLLIAVDQEGGKTDRLTSAVGFKESPNAETVASSMDDALAEKTYFRVATDLASWGFNVNFGPVVDVNVNPDNPIIGRLGRSFSSDPVTVSAYAAAFVEAHKKAGMITALKHFPGHGSSRTDSHKTPTDVTTTWRPEELDPYRTLIGKNDAAMIMSAHVINRKISGDNEPSSLSRETITELLRNELHFTGVVITDDMQMEAIASTRSLEQAVTEAVLAGNDILLFVNDKHPDPQVPEKIAEILLRQARENPLMLERIREASDNVAKLKKKI